MRSKQLVADWSQAVSRKSWEWELQSPAGKIKGPDEVGQGTINTGTRESWQEIHPPISAPQHGHSHPEIIPSSLLQCVQGTRAGGHHSPQ